MGQQIFKKFEQGETTTTKLGTSFVDFKVSSLPSGLRMSAGKFINTYNFPCLRMFLNEIFIVRLYNFITRRSKIVSLATSRRLNKYVKAEYCKQKYSLFQISKLFTCFPCLRMFLNEIFIVRLYNFITRRSKIVSLATSRRLNKYVKAEYCKQKYSLFQISKLFTCLRFQEAFKTAAGCYFEP